jgi:hypothetical protein
MNQLRRHRYGSIFAESEERTDHSRIRIRINRTWVSTSVVYFMPILLKGRPPGSALCCFERSSLPQHRGTRTAVIRIVKILSPPICVYPNYDGCVPLPVEGELVNYIYKRRGLQPKSFNVDSPQYTGAENVVSGRELMRVGPYVGGVAWHYASKIQSFFWYAPIFVVSRSILKLSVQY